MSVDHAILESDGHLQRLLDVHLVESNGSSVFIKFLDLQWEEASLHRTKMSEAGRRSAERRSTKVEPTLNLPSTYVEPMLNLPSTDVQPMFNREEKRRGEKRREEDSVLFEQFWATYPRKTAKQAAVKAFSKLKESEQQEAISNIKRLFSNTPVEFVPHPATYINNKRWEDQTIVRGNTFANPLNQSNDNDLPIFR